MNKEEELIEAAQVGNLEKVKELLDQGIDIHVGDDWALCWAAENGHLEVVKCLVGRGANIHAQGDEALRWAAMNGHLELAKYLVEQGRYSIEELLTHSNEAIRDYALKEYRDGQGT